jgi:glycine betaine catabolism B
MKAIVAVSLSLLFAGLATFNVISIFESSRPSRKPRSRALAVTFHRVGGYLFIGLFSVMIFYMSKRLIGYPGEIQADMLIHIGLALLLAPLLFVKVLIARRYKSYHSMLMPLGLTIYAITIVLVFMAVLPFALSKLDSSSPMINDALIALVLFCIFLVTLAFRPARQSSVSLSAPSLPQPPSSLGDAASGVFSLELAAIDAQTSDAKSLSFRVPDGISLRAKPGQFLTFHLDIDGKKVIRSYTICSSPLKSDHVEITPKRTQNGCASVFLNESAAPGMIVNASGPFGQFYFDENLHKNIVLIAAGSGITPMIAMLRYIEDRALNTPVTLIYSVRTSQDIIFKNELTRLSCSLPNFRTVVTLSAPDINWKGHRGRISSALLQQQIHDFAAPTFFLCGPKAFMKLASDLLTEQGVAADRIKQESFGESSLPAISTPPASASFETVEFLRSARNVKLNPGMTILEIAEMSGISIPNACRQGQCGTCATQLLGGSVTMDAEDGLTPDQKKAGYILPCVSRARFSICIDA